MITLSGAQVWPEASGRPTGVPTLRDIGAGLGRIVRFAGQTTEFYTVLPHVLTVAAMLPSELALDGLMHDAPECIVSDVPSPWKTDGAKAAEAELMARLSVVYGMTWPLTPEAHLAVAMADYHALLAEGDILGHNTPASLRYIPEWGEPKQEFYDLTTYHLTNMPQYVHPEVAGPIFEQAFETYASLREPSSDATSVA